MKRKSIQGILLAAICLLSAHFGFGQTVQELIRLKEQHAQSILSGRAQPGNQAARAGVMGPEQDCDQAITVCSNSYSQATSYMGPGNVTAPASGTTCLTSGETNSVWYTFTVTQNGTFTFTLTTQNDYDFAVYNITNSSCADIPNLTPVRCNYSGTPV
jgi:hypothetical protein